MQMLHVHRKGKIALQQASAGATDRKDHCSRAAVSWCVVTAVTVFIDSKELQAALR